MTETKIEFTELLGRRVRMGPWEDQKISTYRKIIEALDGARWDEAATLGSYFVDEANVCFTLYRQWIGDLNGYLRDKGVDEAVIQARNDQAVALSRRSPTAHPGIRASSGTASCPRSRTSPAATYREQADDAKAELDVMKETWRQCHDRDVDHTYALMSLIKEQLGEAAIRDMYDRVLLPLFVWRYEKFDIDKYPWDESLEILMLVACEAMRGHLVGPERTGDMELVELEDRFILRFDPCGSGQRTIRGDWIEGTPPRMRAALRLEGDRGAAHLEPQHAGRLPLLHPLHHPHGGDADGPLRLPGPRRRPAGLPGHEHGSERRAEMPVADVQGPDPGARGVLHPGRADEADVVRLQGPGRP